MQIIFLILPIIAIIGAVFSIKNAIDSYHKYRRFKEELLDKIHNNTYQKMNDDIEKHGFVLRKGEWIW